MWQQAIADQTHELSVREDVWRGLLLEGRGITGEAWLTPRAIVQQLVEASGDYVMIVQDNPSP